MSGVEKVSELTLRKCSLMFTDNNGKQINNWGAQNKSWTFFGPKDLFFKLIPLADSMGNA